MTLVTLWAVVAVTARFLERTWWSAGAMLALIFWISAVGTTIFAPEYYASFRANLYLASLTLVTSLATVIGRTRKAHLAPKPVHFSLIRRTELLTIAWLASLAGFAFTLRAIGAGLPDLASPMAILRAAQAATYLRYTQGLHFPLAYNIANATFLGAVMAATSHMVSARRIDAAFIGPIMIFAAGNMLITTRAPILFMLILVTFAGLATIQRVDTGASFPALLSKPVLCKALPIIAILVGMFMLFQILRFGEGSTRSMAEVWAHLRRWPWGSLPGFALWFDGFGAATPPSIPGFYTFMGLYDNLGIAARQTGGYGDYIPLTATEAANIYTVFRGLHHDFGAVGSAVFMGTIGFCGGIAATGRALPPIVSIPLYTGVMGFVAFAFVVSFWAFTANLAALFVLPLIYRRMFQMTPLTE